MKTIYHITSYKASMIFKFSIPEDLESLDLLFIYLYVILLVTPSIRIYQTSTR
jgi:hypothetical protein